MPLSTFLFLAAALAPPAPATATPPVRCGAPAQGVETPEAAATSEGAATAETDALPLAERVDRALVEGVAWLVANQRPDGAWGSHHSPRPIEVLASVPGSHDAFRVATTGLCISALQDALDRRPELFPDPEAAEAAIARGVGHLLEEWNVKRVDGLEHYNVWAFGYGLRALGERVLRHPEEPRVRELRETIDALVAKMVGYQSLDGGWGYLSITPPITHPPAATSMSFTSATLLVGLDRARQAGAEVPERTLRRALDSIERCRMPSGSYAYGEMWRKNPARLINQDACGACRTPACQVALLLFDREVPEAAREKALEDLLVRHARFQSVALRRPIPHESWYYVSGYFYLYGHAYAAMLLEGLDARAQRRYAPLLASAVLLCRAPDGSFWDYPLYGYHDAYGTGYALLALSRLALADEESERPRSPAPSEEPAASPVPLAPADPEREPGD